MSKSPDRWFVDAIRIQMLLRKVVAHQVDMRGNALGILGYFDRFIFTRLPCINRNQTEKFRTLPKDLENQFVSYFRANLRVGPTRQLIFGANPNYWTLFNLAQMASKEIRKCTKHPLTREI